MLVACAHGTRGADGRRAVGTLVAAVQAARRDLVVRAAFVDVQEPTVADVVHEVTDAGSSAVVVPLLLSAGYHVAVDIGRAVHGRAADRDACARPGRPAHRAAARPAARRRGPRRGRRRAGRRGVQRPGRGARRRARGRGAGRPARGPGHGRATAPPPRPRWPRPSRTARHEHPARRVVVAAYLLAPGHFHGRLGEVGADVVTAALLSAAGPPDPRLVEIVLDRYDAGVRSLLRD